MNQKKGEAEPGFLRVLSAAAEGHEHWKVEPPPGWRETELPPRGAGELADRHRARRRARSPRG